MECLRCVLNTTNTNQILLQNCFQPSIQQLDSPSHAILVWCTKSSVLFLYYSLRSRPVDPDVVCQSVRGHVEIMTRIIRMTGWHFAHDWPYGIFYSINRFTDRHIHTYNSLHETCLHPCNCKMLVNTIIRMRKWNTDTF